ncbi:hypothetical protein PV779_13995 [Streptomyces sp. ID01-9D]|nr:hypothetical protein [Streptomyces sp. ID01-9D]
MRPGAPTLRRYRGVRHASRMPGRTVARMSTRTHLNMQLTGQQREQLAALGIDWATA